MEQLTRKETNRINSALKQSTLGIFDTKEKRFPKDMGQQTVSSMSRCTAEIKKYLDTFLCSSSTNENLKRLFSTIDSEGLSNISEVCSSIQNNEQALNRMTIRTIFGGTEKMPFRGLVYILPAINLCEQLRNINGSSIPNIEYLFMNGAGIQANAIDPYRAEETTAQFINFAQAYINEFHPEIADKINFYVDRTFSSDIIKTPEYQNAHKALEEKLNIGSGLRYDLEEMGKRRDSAENSIKYATLHAFVQDGMIDSQVAKMSNFFGGAEQKDCDIIVSIGAKPEETFFKARKILAEIVSRIDYFTPKKTAQYIANINVPPYSPLKNGELYLSDVLKEPELVTRAKQIDRRRGEFCEYQMPVQKAVEMIIADTKASNSDKDLYEFIQEYTRCKDEKKIEI